MDQPADTQVATDPFDRTDLLVGRFFRLFGGIEAELNEAIRKLFELTPNSVETVCANIDFFKKVKIVRSALTDQDQESQHRERIKTVFKDVARINDIRQIAAHSSIKPNGDDGVVFYRVVANTGLERTYLRPGPKNPVTNCLRKWKIFANSSIRWPSQLRPIIQAWISRIPAIANTSPSFDFRCVCASFCCSQSSPA